MAGFLGGDTDAMREFSSVIDERARQVLERMTALQGQAESVAWRGPDREQLMERLGTAVQHASASTDLARDRAAQLRDHAEAQDAASDPESGGSGDRGGDRGDSDVPGNPELDSEGLGEYEEYDGTPPMGDEDLSMDEMNQGQVGDCWFLAGLGGIAAQDPQWIRDHMWSNPDGTWTVKMYDDGVPVYIQVESTFPQNGARDASGDVSYASIYEKAAAEFFGGDYSDIDGGYSDDAFEAIYGRPAQREGETDFDSIEAALERGPVAVGTETDPSGWDFPWTDTIDEDNIVPDHAYVVEEIIQPSEENGHEEPMIVLRNPWGPGGGTLDGIDRDGTLTLTEQQYKDSFDSTYSMEG